MADSDDVHALRKRLRAGSWNLTHPTTVTETDAIWTGRPPVRATSVDRRMAVCTPLILECTVVHDAGDNPGGYVQVQLDTPTLSILHAYVQVVRDKLQLGDAALPISFSGNGGIVRFRCAPTGAMYRSPVTWQAVHADNVPTTPYAARIWVECRSTVSTLPSTVHMSSMPPVHLTVDQILVQP